MRTVQAFGSRMVLGALFDKKKWTQSVSSMGGWQFAMDVVLQFSVSCSTPVMHSVRDEPLFFPPVLRFF